MTVYSLGISLRELISDATPTGTLDPYRVNGVVPGAWPYTFALGPGEVTVHFDDTVATYEIVTDTGNPLAAGTWNLSFPFTSHDGEFESAPADFPIILEGASGGTTPLAPDAFGSGDWALNDVPSIIGNQLEIDITALPADNGASLTALKYSVDSGSGYGTAQTLSGTGTGARLITVLASTTANVRLWAENSEGAGPVSTKSRTPTVLTPEPAADVTVANSSDLNTLLGQLHSNYGATVGGYGKTVADEFYVDCSSGAYSNSFSSKVFANKVHVRAADRAGGCTRSNTSITNTTNLRVAYFAITGTGVSEAMEIGAGCVNVLASHCQIYGHPSSTGWAVTAGGALTAAFVITGAGGVNPDQCGIEYSVVERGGSGNIKIHQATNIYVGYNIADRCRTDDIKLADVDGGLVENNWGSVFYLAAAGAHLDFIQFYKENATGLGVRNVTLRGNINGDWLNPDPHDQPYRQNQLVTVAHQNITIEQNIFVGGNTHGMNLLGTGYVVRNNTMVRQGGTTNIYGTLECHINGSGSGTFTDNVEVGPGSKAGSLEITQADYLTYFGALRVGGEAWQPIGVGGDFSDLVPPTGVATHWGFGGTIKGAAIRTKEVVVDGLHPGNDGWPTAAKWQATHNVHGRITS